MTLYWGADHEVPQSQVSEPSHLWYFHIDTYLHFYRALSCGCVCSLQHDARHTGVLYCVLFTCARSACQNGLTVSAMLFTCAQWECQNVLIVSDTLFTCVQSVCQNRLTVSLCCVVHVCTVSMLEWASSLFTCVRSACQNGLTVTAVVHVCTVSVSEWTNSESRWTHWRYPKDCSSHCRGLVMEPDSSSIARWIGEYLISYQPLV